MPTIPEFEYSYRWHELADDLRGSVDKLEARDQALEQHLRNFGGSSCSINFEYHFRWVQILDEPDVNRQMALLDDRDRELEDAVRATGACPLEFPYRWPQFWEDLLAGDDNAINMAEENDRLIEGRFSSCSCGGSSVSGFICDSSLPALNCVDTLGSGFGSFILPADTIVSAFTYFGYNVAGGSVSTGGTLLLNKVVGASETTLASLTLTTSSSADQMDVSPVIPAGTHLVMRTSGIVLTAGADLNAIFSFESLSAAFANHEWAAA